MDDLSPSTASSAPARPRRRLPALDIPQPNSPAGAVILLAALCICQLVMAPAPAAATHTGLLFPGVFSADDMAISGDTAIVGDGFLDDTGAAVILVRRPDGTWNREARLVPPDGRTFTLFGNAVAISGDVAAVGAYFAATVFVFERAGGAWRLAQQLQPDVPGDATTEYGARLVIDGNRLLVGAPGQSAVYVYRHSGGTWVRSARIDAPEPAGATETVDFGRAIDIEGDTIVVGSPSSDGRGIGSGAVYIFTSSDGQWRQQARLEAQDARPDDQLGGAVALSGDTVLAGATAAARPGRYTGAAYLFTRRDGVWSQQARLLPRDREDGDAFGSAVALQNDTALVASGHRDEGFGRGAVYLFRRYGDRWSVQQKLYSSDPRADFGNLISASGETAVVGGFNFGADEPAAYIFTLAPEAHLLCPGDIDGDGLGDLITVSRAGEVRATDFQGRQVNAFALAPTEDIVDVALVGDTNGNGAPEIAALDGPGARTFMVDSLSSAALGASGLPGYLDLLQLAVLPDQTSNGIPELATLGWRPITAQVREGLTGQPLARPAYLHADYNVRDIAVYPDANGNGAAELTVLAERKRGSDSDSLEMRDSATGERLQSLWLAGNHAVRQHAVIGDVNGNGAADIAVLRIEPSPSGRTRGRVSVVVRDGASRAGLGVIDFDRHYPPSRLFAVPDINGNGADELVVFGRRLGYGSQRVEVRDSRTGTLIRVLYFDRQAAMQDVATCPDLDGNGSAELAMLGRDSRSRRLRTVVKDLGSGQRLAVVVR